MEICSIDLAHHRPNVDPTLAIESIRAIGKDAFAERLVGSLSRYFRLAHLSMFSFGPEHRPNLLGTSSTLSARIAYDTALTYLGSHYQSDPGQHVRDAEKPDTQQVHVQYQIASDIVDTGYRINCYEQPGIVDRLSILQRSEDNAWIAVNVYRDRSQGLFSRSDFDALMTVAPILTAAADRHAQLLHLAKASDCSDHYALIARVNPRLSQREKEVCAGILDGLTAKQIAKRLGIAPTSVITHRKNAYLKLGINDHKQLFALVR
ncbi:helix-turn-helix transcriptional regulator [Noviherbaspirillum saxi]|nr:LuxR C-terminal-related transcriptional regulator [Noviherbaspirillum saxi]